MLNNFVEKIPIVNADPRTKTLLIALRQALIIALGALEDYLGIERSIIPKHSGGREARAGREDGR
jgi:hypothetical protein